MDGTEYGEVRQYGNFSFLRVYESGHEVPYYQPVAALEMFRRVLNGLVSLPSHMFCCVETSPWIEECPVKYIVLIRGGRTLRMGKYSL